LGHLRSRGLHQFVHAHHGFRRTHAVGLLFFFVYQRNSLPAGRTLVPLSTHARCARFAADVLPLARLGFRCCTQRSFGCAVCDAHRTPSFSARLAFGFVCLVLHFAPILYTCALPVPIRRTCVCRSHALPLTLAFHAPFRCLLRVAAFVWQFPLSFARFFATRLRYTGYARFTPVCAPFLLHQFRASPLFADPERYLATRPAPFCVARLPLAFHPDAPTRSVSFYLFSFRAARTHLAPIILDVSHGSAPHRRCDAATRSALDTRPVATFAVYAAPLTRHHVGSDDIAVHHIVHVRSLTRCRYAVPLPLVWLYARLPSRLPFTVAAFLACSLPHSLPSRIMPAPRARLHICLAAFQDTALFISLPVNIPSVLRSLPLRLNACRTTHHAFSCGFPLRAGVFCFGSPRTSHVPHGYAQHSHARFGPRRSFTLNGLPLRCLAHAWFFRCWHLPTRIVAVP